MSLKNILPIQIYDNLNDLQEKAAYFCLLFLIIYLFVYSGAISVCTQVLATVRRHQKLPPCWTVGSSQLQDSYSSGQSWA